MTPIRMPIAPDVITRIVAGHPQIQRDDLLTWVTPTPLKAVG